jgi:AcrR family transcriptional regulator
VEETKRAYRSELRVEQARRTRAAVLDAAAACFVRDGYATTTMKAIAAEAGVSLQTVFTQGTKAALLLAAVDRGVVGDDEEIPLRDRAAFHRATTGTKAERLAAIAEMGRNDDRTAGPIMSVFRQAATGDAEIATHWAEYQRRSYADISRLIASFGPMLREDLDATRAADIFWAIFLGDTSDTLRRQRGWTMDEYLAWMTDAIDRLLLR